MICQFKAFLVLETLDSGISAGAPETLAVNIPLQIWNDSIGIYWNHSRTIAILENEFCLRRTKEAKNPKAFLSKFFCSNLDKF